MSSTFNQLVHMMYNIRQAPYLHDSQVASQARLENEKYLNVYSLAGEREKKGD